MLHIISVVCFATCTLSFFIWCHLKFLIMWPVSTLFLFEALMTYQSICNICIVLCFYFILAGKDE